MLVGDNGLISRIIKERREAIIAEEKERITLAWNALILGKATGSIDNNINEDEFAGKFEEELNKSGNDTYVEYVAQNEYNYYKVTFEKTKHTYAVDLEGNIEMLDYATHGTALIGNTSYNSLQEAIDDIPTNNTVTKIKLLKNVSEVLTVTKNKKIIFDFQNHTLCNNGVNVVIANDGDITILNGTITSSTSQGAINNNSGAKLTISGGSVIATGTRQAIYNNGGTVEITGDAYLSAVSTERATVQNNSSTSNLYITGGTIISTGFKAVQNAGVMNIGVKDSNVDLNSPYIQGKTFGVTSATNFNFYDGIIKGGIDNNAIENETKVIEKQPGYAIGHSTETIDNVTYKTAFLEPTTAATITFYANGGTVSETTRIVTTRRYYRNITGS